VSQFCRNRRLLWGMQPRKRDIIGVAWFQIVAFREPEMSILHDREQGKFRQWIGWTCLLTLIDQASKALVRLTMLPGSRSPVIDNVLFIHFIPNYRGFSWFVPDLPEWVQPLFLALRITVLLMAFPVYEFYRQSNSTSVWAWIALIAVSAGIAGNLLDDIFVPYTTDFIQVFQSPSANFADLFAYIGMVAFAVESGIQWRREKPQWSSFRTYLAHMAQIRQAFFAFLREYFVRKR
jgi:lipoprotein signal peptidase